MAVGGSFVANAQTLQITSPAAGTIVNPGQTLSVTLAVSGVSLTDVFVLGETPMENSQDLTVAPYQVTIQIPANINLRSYGIRAVGLDASGNSYSSSRVTIDVERADTPTSVTANPTLLYKLIGDTGYVRVAATYADGAVLDATESSLVSYAAGDPTVATVDNVGRVRAVGAGATNITITYGTLSATVPITVPPQLTVSCGQSSVFASQTAQFYADFAMLPDPNVGDPPNTDVTWTLTPALGTIDANGLYTAPASVASWQGVTVTATSVADPTKSASAQVWVFPPVSLTLSPSTATLLAGQHLELVANANSDGGAGVTWSVTPDSVGSFWWNQNTAVFPYPIPLGEYTAPAPIVSPQTVTVTATSVYDNSRTASAQITLVPSVPLAVNPSTTTIYSTASVQLTPAITYDPAGTVTWSISPNQGTISTSGLYTAPADVSAPLTVTVTATSVDSTWAPDGGNATYTATATITVLPQPVSGAITAPGTLQANVISNSEVDLAWTPSTEAGATVAGYHIFRNGVWAGTTSTPSFADRGLLSSTAYSYTVAAFDTNWNASAKSAAAGGTTLAGIPNLVAYYNFDEGAGTALFDSSGNGNNGVISGAAVWSSSGRMGGALVFDGTTNLVTVPGGGSLNMTTGMTLEAWVQPTTWPSSGIVSLLNKYIDGTSEGQFCYTLFGSVNGISAGVTTGGRWIFDDGTQSVPLNTWTHLAVTYDGAALTLFFNGEQQSSTPVTGPIATSAQPLFIGGDQPYGEFFNGMIDEIRIYNRALSQAEIQSDIAASSPPPPSRSAITPPRGAQAATVQITIAGNSALI